MVKISDEISYKDKEKEILKSILLKEEDTLQKLQTIVSKSTPFLKVDETGKVILSDNYDFSNSDKICLLLIGKYLAEKAEILNSPWLTLKQISDEVGVIITTLSAPLGNLVKDGKIEKTNQGLYRIRYYEIENILDNLAKKLAI